MDALTITRRRLLQTSAAAGAAMSLGMSASFAPEPGQDRNAPPPQLGDYAAKVAQLRDQVRALVRGWVDAGRLVRPDGFVYAVDVAQLMACFVDAGDADAYGRLRG